MCVHVCACMCTMSFVYERYIVCVYVCVCMKERYRELFVCVCVCVCERESCGLMKGRARKSCVGTALENAQLEGATALGLTIA